MLNLPLLIPSSLAREYSSVDEASHHDEYLTTMPTARSEFMAGVKALLPILLGVIPFGMISGIAVVQTHIPPVSGFVMSLLIFSGAALIVALQLITTGAPALVVVFSALVINLRFMIYSASLAPLFKHLSVGRKSLLAYLLSDQAYAASITHLSESAFPQVSWLHFLGSGPCDVVALADQRGHWNVRRGTTAFQLVAGVHHPTYFSRIGSASHQGPLHTLRGADCRVRRRCSPDRRPSTPAW